MTTPSSKASVLPKQFIRRVMIIVGIKAIIITVFMLHFFQQTLQKTPEVCFQEKCFQVEIADTPEKRELGLMFRETLPEQQGMFFIFEKPEKKSFWMRNTLIPLDIIWLDHENKVIDMVSALPCEEQLCESYLPSQEASSALELASGTIATLQLKKGDQRTIKR